jgi:tRNA A-37 threonylcarbamoyl transferase component Bud32
MTEIARLGEALSDRYRLERELGQGGMATVYLAEDLKHRRRVAIKVLHPELSAVIGGERFLKEIELTASLQHPHILPLFDSGAADNLLYYVMPFVEGETLRTRLQHERQLPVEEAVRIAQEVATALDYAHKRSVVHRDIKPENVLLQDGAALVADFGIALAVTNAGAGRLTQTGLSLGTPHYMSPEQAMGEREITPRADVYALGAMTYEMLVGEPPFTGPSAQAIVAKVLTEKPVLATVHRDTVPTHVAAAVQKALAKLPADRFGSAADFAAALVNPAFGSGALQATTQLGAASTRLARRVPRLAGIAVPLGAVIAAVILTAIALRRPAPPAPVQQFAIAFKQEQAPNDAAPFAISPDGAWLAYQGPSERGTRVWLKPRDAWEATPLDGTEGASNFTFSPDSRWIAFVQNFQVKKVPVTGGAPIVIADSSSNFPGLAWMDDGSIIHVQAGARAIRRVPDAGGEYRVVWRDTTASLGFMTPLPGARGVLVTRCRGGCAEADLYVVDLRSGEARLLQTGAAKGFYVRTGHVLFVRRDGALLALPFDLDKLEARGTPVPVRDGVSVLDGIYPLMTIADDGTLVLRAGASGSLQERYRLVWLDRDGRESPIDSSWSFRQVFYGANAGWALSPDGTHLALGIASDAGDDIWVKRLPNGPALRITFDSAPDFRPRWMPDGRSIMFSSIRRNRGLYRRPADGTGADERITSGDIFEAQISRDGQWLVARAGGQVSQSGGRGIGAMRFGVDSLLSQLIDTPYDESEIVLSPDGRWLAYVSDETGRPELFVRPFPDVGRARYQISSGGGAAPLWSRDGRELFFLNADRGMTVVTVAPGAELRLGEPQVLFRLNEDIYPLEREYYTPYDISPDGRFIMARLMRSTASQQAPLIMTLNWFDQLKRQLEQK